MLGAIMKLALVLPFAFADLVGVARADEADKVRETTKAEAEAFTARVYAGAPATRPMPASSGATTQNIWPVIPSRRSPR